MFIGDRVSVWEDEGVLEKEGGKYMFLHIETQFKNKHKRYTVISSFSFKIKIKHGLLPPGGRGAAVRGG